MPVPPSAKEIKTAVSKKGCEAIPYPDLRVAGQREYGKQTAECKNCTCDGLAKPNEIEAARTRSKLCFEQRIKVRTIFKEAIGRVKQALQGMKPGEPLKPDLTKILQELESSQRGHEIAIDQVKNTILKCDEKLKKLSK